MTSKHSSCLIVRKLEAINGDEQNECSNSGFYLILFVKLSSPVVSKFSYVFSMNTFESMKKYWGLVTMQCRNNGLACFWRFSLLFLMIYCTLTHFLKETKSQCQSCLMIALVRETWLTTKICILAKSLPLCIPLCPRHKAPYSCRKDKQNDKWLYIRVS